MSKSLGEFIVKKLSERYKIEKRDFAPLNFEDPFLILISIILSQNTTDKNALKAMQNLISNGLIKPEDYLKVSKETLFQLIRPAGLYEQKGETIIRVARWVVQKFSGDLRKIKDLKLSEAEKELLSIKGIGEKTKDVFLGFYLGAKTFPIDTHIKRVAKRIGIGEGGYKTMKEMLLKTFKDPMKAHMLLIEHGRKTCTARNPKCDLCPIKEICRFYKEKISKDT